MTPPRLIEKLRMIFRLSNKKGSVVDQENMEKNWVMHLHLPQGTSAWRKSTVLIFMATSEQLLPMSVW